MGDKNQSFSYTYSATQQEEVKRIRRKFIPPEENKMEQLRKLDELATRPGKIRALVLGIVSSLVFGVGMCCTMLWQQYFAPGIAIGLIGIAGMCMVYPTYLATTKRRREKLAPEIMRLSAELMGGE